MIFSQLDKVNVYMSFGVSIGDFSKLSHTIDTMSPSVVEYFLSSLIINYDEESVNINFSEYIQVGDYMIYHSSNGDLYLKSNKKSHLDDPYETGSLF